MKNFSSGEWSGIVGLLIALLFVLYTLFSKWKSPWE